MNNEKSKGFLKWKPEDVQKFKETALLKIRIGAMSTPFMIGLALLAALLIVLQKEILLSCLFAGIISFLLLFCDDILASLLPFLLLSVSLLQCFDSFDTFIELAPYGVFPIAAFAFHFIYYHRKFKIGPTFYGLLAVSFALMMGGVGNIPKKEYFAPITLFYMFALGLGMAGAYVLLKAQIHVRKEYDIKEKFINILYIMGMLAAFQVFIVCIESISPLIFDGHHLVPNEILITWRELLEMLRSSAINRFASEELHAKWDLLTIKFQIGNNASTFMLFSLIAPFYKVVKGKKWHILGAVPISLGLIFSMSRAGLLMGAITGFLCLLFLIIFEKNKVWKTLYIVGTTLLLLFAGLLFIHFQKNKAFDGFVSETEKRYRLIYRAVDHFKNHPFVGHGIGSTVNADLYNGKTGTLPWYHMMIPQIMGSMGLIGIFCYSFQFLQRAYLVIRKRSAYVAALALSYIGLLLMSQVNPGEFCPIPYGLLATTIFIFIEMESDKKKKEKKPKVDEKGLLK